MSTDTTRDRPWWLSPGPVSVVVATAVACGVVIYQGVRSAHRPIDVVDRNDQLVRTGSFCDAPKPLGGTPRKD